MTWRELCDEFGFDDVNAMPLLWCMEALVDQGLVTVDGLDEAAIAGFFYECLGDRECRTDARKIRVSSSWRRMHTALFTQFDERGRPLFHDVLPFTMNVTPLFGPPMRLAKVMTVFVAMPFDAALDAVYKQIRQAAQSLYLSCGRADDIFSANVVLNDIWSAISGAAAVVGECTGRNPNVFYELGIAHTIGKPVVLITQDGTDVPFDVQHVRYIRYDCTPEGLTRLESSLRETLKSAIKR